MTKTLTRIAATALVATLIPLPAFAQQMDHSSHANHQMHAMDASADDVAGAEETLKAYRTALEARDAQAMRALFDEDSAIFENGKAEGSFANYMEHHLGPELDAIVSFTFTDPTLTVTRIGHMAHAYETYGYRIELSDGRVIERDGVATSVLAHDADGWRIVQYHSSSRAPRN
ncbi:MAG: nuclear transport factor 2 family protein [Pseudomonadota bacterium]|nr:nuclear transport factor 2 family protein [Pseudomonadota bacterium]